MSRIYYGIKGNILDVEKYAKNRWRFAYMLLDISIKKDKIILRTITLINVKQYRIKLKMPYYIGYDIECSELFKYFDRIELRTSEWYNKLDTHVNSAKWLEKYPYLCRWGCFDDDGDLWGTQQLAVYSKNLQKTSSFFRIKDTYYIGYTMEWQEIHQRYVLPQPAIPVDHDANSWYRHNCDVIFENPVETEGKPAINSRKIKLHPTTRQANLMLTWHKIYNQVYNIALSTFNRLGRVSSKYTLRDTVKANLSVKMNNKIKSCGIPAHTVSYAIFDVVDAYKSNIKKGGFFRLRKKKSTNGSMAIEKLSIKKNGIAVRKLGRMLTEPGFSFEDVTMGCRLKKQNNGFYLCVPYEVKKKKFNTELVCGLDPGIRTFQTVYQSDGKVYDVCTNYEAKIRPILERIDRIADIPKARRCKLRLYERIKNLTEDMHWKTIKWLTSKYRKIHIGKISTSGIVQQTDLNKMQKRLMLAQSHFTFRMRLKSKCKEYNVDFIEVHERNTSVTCGNCRSKHENLEGNKVYDCVKCGYHADRDANAARNILIRGMTNRQD